MVDSFVVSGTGSRSLQNASVAFKYEVFQKTIDSLTTLGATSVIAGMAEGFDSCLARAAVYCGLPFLAAVPNPTYGEYYWGKHSVTGTDRYREYVDLLSLAEEVVVVSDTIKVGRRHSNLIRNEYMVDNCDSMLVFDPTSTGTSSCLKYIKKVQRPFFIIGEMPR